MVIAFARWWYGDGWRAQVTGLLASIDRTADAYSFGLLVRTFFAPFRQISAGGVRGPVGVQLRAWTDRQISRVIGAMVRSAVMAAGLVVVAVLLTGGMVRVLVWPLLPVLPVAGVLLALLGWTPWI
jgi:hypothetical protein